MCTVTVMLSKYLQVLANADSVKMPNIRQIKHSTMPIFFFSFKNFSTLAK